MSKLITTSLIGSIDFFKNAPYAWKDKAYQDLSNMLNRVWTGYSEEAKQGCDFEDKIYFICSKFKDSTAFKMPGSEHFKAIAEKCMGGTFQDKIKMNFVIDGESYCLYGKTDVLFKNQIIDIKTTKQLKPEKYTNSFQHHLYMFITGIEFFQYIIAEWDVYPKIKNVHYVDIAIKNPKISLEEKIVSTIRETINFLSSRPILWKAYNTKYSIG